MARQEIILGTPPAGLGGDPPRTASMKINAMTQELYDKFTGLGTAAHKGAQASVDDMTAGRLLGVGAFGWNGGFAIVKGNGTDLNTLTVPSIYACNGTYLNGYPGVSDPVYIRVTGHGTGYLKQEMMGITSNFSAFRNLINNAWQPWSFNYTANNVVGGVRADGLGALFERGDNAYGSFTKFADGRMICTGRITTAVLPANLSTSTRGSYPASFIAGSYPVFSGTVRASLTTDHYGAINGDQIGAGRESGPFFTIRNGATAQSFDYFYMAVGVWK